MGVALYTNNASSTLAAGINAAVTSFSVAAGQGALFPNPTGGDYFYVTLSDAASGLVIEICKCTARSTDALTVTRGSQGTTPAAFLTADKVELRPTATGFTELAALGGTNTYTGYQALAAGAVGTPSLYLSTDTTTGLYRIGANNYGVAVSGAKVLDIASTGLAVTGTLSATGSATATALIPSGSSVPTNGMYLSAANTLAWATNSAVAMRLSATGSLTLANTTSGYLVVNGDNVGVAGASFGYTTTYGTSIVSGTGTNSDFVLWKRGGLGSVMSVSPNSTNVTFGGDVSVTSALSKGSGSFRIPHPLPEKTATHQLVHSFIEGPQVDLIYRGKATLVDGKAKVNIDEAATMTEGTFVALCRDVQCFTTNESDWTPVKGGIIGNLLTIESQDSNSTASISWMVIGERKDKHIMETDWTDDNGKVIVEPVKLEAK